MLFVRSRVLFNKIWSNGRGWVLIFVAIGWGLSIGSRYIFPVMFPYLRKSFKLNLATLGTYFTLLWVAYALLQFAGGMLADRYGERNILAISSFMSGGAMLIVGLVPSSRFLAGGMAIFGFASALYGTTRYTVLADIYPDYDGTAIGITQSVGEAGNTLLPAIASLLAVYVSWRLAFIVIFPLFAVVSVGLWLVVPRHTSVETTAINELSFTSFKYIFSNVKSTQTMVLAGILTLTMFVIQGVTAFYPTYLIDVKGISPPVAGIMFSSLFVSAGVVMLISGMLVDTFSSQRVLVLVIGISTISLVLYPFIFSPLRLIIVTIMFSSMYGVITVGVKELTNSLPNDMRGSGLGILRTAYILLAATGSLLVGTLAENGLFDESFFILAIPATTAIGLTASLSHLTELSS